MTGALRFADFRKDSIVLLDGATHRVTGTEADGATVTLVVEDGSERSIAVSLVELYAKVCEGTAQTLDPIVRADLADNSPPVTIAFLSTAARIDWYHRMILLRGLLRVSGCAPKSAAYRRAYSDTTRLLAWVRENSGISSEKSWSAKRTNDVLRNWRHHGGAFAAFLVQCVPARRRRRTDPTMQEFRDLVRATAKSLPDASTASLHRVAGAAWRARKAAKDAGDGPRQSTSELNKSRKNSND